MTVKLETGLPEKCLGPADAKNFLVYLHGMDYPNLSTQERTNRAILVRLATQLQFRIALPRAAKACPTKPESRCWGWNLDDHEVEATKKLVDTAAKECFPKNAKYGLLGFSNGGYLLSKTFRDCTFKEHFANGAWLILVGAARRDGPLVSPPDSLQGCGSLTILSGDSDQFNSDSKQNLISQLKLKGADAEEIPYTGGHILPEEPLHDLLQMRFTP